MYKNRNETVHSFDPKPLGFRIFLIEGRVSCVSFKLSPCFKLEYRETGVRLKQRWTIRDTLTNFLSTNFFHYWRCRSGIRGLVILFYIESNRVVGGVGDPWNPFSQSKTRRVKRVNIFSNSMDVGQQYHGPVHFCTWFTNHVPERELSGTHLPLLVNGSSSGSGSNNSNGQQK